MSSIKYRIYRLSARAVMGYGERDGDWFSFTLNKSATEQCKINASHKQEDNALFYQIMDELYGGKFSTPADGKMITELSDVIFYMDFSGIFDRTSQEKKYADRLLKAKSMFRRSGVTLDFGSGKHRYLAFERSGSMSRKAVLSFIREDLYAVVTRRITIDLNIGMCQLSKLYAYNGLMMSSGKRIDGIGIEKVHRVIVIDNPTYEVPNVPVITAEDADGAGNMRVFHRVEKTVDAVKVKGFDGEGLISKEYAATVDKVFCGGNVHTSFQIRMPYVKGMLHKVDFKDFYKMTGTTHLTDIWGVKHKVREVDIILTKSMFKCFDWLEDCGKTWADYWKAFRKYHHALYITQVGNGETDAATRMNFQFLNTLNLTTEEFRPADLPLGWEHSPADDPRDWVTKETEQEYYDFCCDEDFRLQYFIKRGKRRIFEEKTRDYHLAQILKMNPLFIREKEFTKQSDTVAEGIVRRYALGELTVAGDNRYLSGDLLELLWLQVDQTAKRNHSQETFFRVAMTNTFPTTAFYAPGARYAKNENYTILRNPHIARNEEIQLAAYRKKDNMRHYYLGHLHDVIMVDPHMLAAERLGGADYDGDMVRTIASPLLNQCVRRNYYEYSDALTNTDNLPLLMIPTIDPLIRDANDWEARYETVQNTFSARTGQISNAALNRSIQAYNENATSEDRDRYRKEVEMLAILTGLEIDSSKSGVKPDLSMYLRSGGVQRSRFLRYKYIAADDDRSSHPGQTTKKKRLDAYFSSIDWDKVDSNIERLPYLAYKLRELTSKNQPAPADPSLLYTFAVPGWKENLDADVSAKVKALATDYTHCLTRIRGSRQPYQNGKRITDIERILFARGQEDLCDIDCLYAAFSSLTYEEADALYQALEAEKWQFMPPEARESFLQKYLPGSDFVKYYDLLCDFRNGGYRILGHLLGDCIAAYKEKQRKELHKPQDSPAMTAMLNAYENRESSADFEIVVAQECRKQLKKIMEPGQAVKYAVALKLHDFLWDVLYDVIAPYVRKQEVKDNAQ